MRRNEQRQEPNYNYKALYENTQESLANLANAQTAALNRVSLLRTGIVAAMKRHYPTSFTEAEHRLGSRLDTVGDDVLLAYLNAILTTTPPVTAARAAALNKPLMQLQQLLRKEGLPIPDSTDLTVWVNALKAHQEENSKPSEGGLVETPVVVVKEEVDLFADDTEQDFSSSLEDLFDDGIEANLEDLFDDNEDEIVELVQEENNDSTLKKKRSLPKETVDNEEKFEGEAEETRSHENVPKSRVSENQITLPGTNRAPGAGLKPELVAAKVVPKSVKTKTRRIGADGPATVPGKVLDEAVEEVLLSLVKQPAPVFALDLVTAGHSSEVVTTWIDNIRSSPSKGVRVVGAKNHQRKYGDLLIPDGVVLENLPKNWKEKPWGQVVTNMIGARVYETGLLLHKFPNTKTIQITDRVVVIHAVDGRGMTGLVMTTESNLAKNSAGLTAVSDAVESLLTTQLNNIVVLTTATSRKAVEVISNAVGEEGVRRNWEVNVPIITSRPIDYVSNTGVPAVATLG